MPSPQLPRGMGIYESQISSPGSLFTFSPSHCGVNRYRAVYKQCVLPLSSTHSWHTQQKTGWRGKFPGCQLLLSLTSSPWDPSPHPSCSAARRTVTPAIFSPAISEWLLWVLLDAFPNPRLTLLCKAVGEGKSLLPFCRRGRCSLLRGPHSLPKACLLCQPPRSPSPFGEHLNLQGNAYSLRSGVRPRNVHL